MQTRNYIKECYLKAYQGKSLMAATQTNIVGTFDLSPSEALITSTSGVDVLYDRITGKARGINQLSTSKQSNCRSVITVTLVRLCDRTTCKAHGIQFSANLNFLLVCYFQWHHNCIETLKLIMIVDQPEHDIKLCRFKLIFWLWSLMLPLLLWFQLCKKSKQTNKYFNFPKIYTLKKIE